MKNHFIISSSYLFSWFCFLQVRPRPKFQYVLTLVPSAVAPVEHYDARYYYLPDVKPIMMFNHQCSYIMKEETG